MVYTEQAFLVKKLGMCFFRLPTKTISPMFGEMHVAKQAFHQELLVFDMSVPFEGDGKVFTSFHSLNCSQDVILLRLITVV